MVIATQNPFEFEGTYPLPESQLDRFLMRISIGYPGREDELQVLTSHRGGEPVDSLAPAIDSEQVRVLQESVRQVAVDEAIQSYLLSIVHATRRCDELQVGASTRGALSLYRATQALALVEGRDFVVPDDVKRLAVPVLAHRLIAKSYVQAGQRGRSEALIERLVESVRRPDDRLVVVTAGPACAVTRIGAVCQQAGPPALPMGRRTDAGTQWHPLDRESYGTLRGADGVELSGARTNRPRTGIALLEAIVPPTMVSELNPMPESANKGQEGCSGGSI